MASNAQSALNPVLYREPSSVTTGLMMAWHPEQQHLTSSEYLRPSMIQCKCKLCKFILQSHRTSTIRCDTICLYHKRPRKQPLSMGEWCLVCMCSGYKEWGRSPERRSKCHQWRPVHAWLSSHHHCTHLPITSDDINQWLPVIESVAKGSEHHHYCHLLTRLIITSDL